MLNIHRKQLRSCWVSQLLNHTVPGQASLRQFTSIKSTFFSPVTDNLLFLNQRKREIIFPRKNVPTRGSITGPLLAKQTCYLPSCRRGKDKTARWRRRCPTYMTGRTKPFGPGPYITLGRWPGIKWSPYMGESFGQHALDIGLYNDLTPGWENDLDHYFKFWLKGGGN